ncbi:uncharacterized protein LAESUDRAFT_814441 [Laetiporus sulphureus 93-53]|uniref:Uncharacterized protein n=1 Tax=Laetiporus sulphureus 93-53 TaxID=1314785 RepID=A0A165CZ19_9APHY|nr:uncharacterized protein LAESUDRAFT_814441 [Laetiporus sulphureus 93-53]KZT03784.1 hypothetical protein LAESUDRAFT_814441 [Laetiporus sulphureus 93-53]
MSHAVARIMDIGRGPSEFLDALDAFISTILTPSLHSARALVTPVLFPHVMFPTDLFGWSVVTITYRSAGFTVDPIVLVVNVFVWVVSLSIGVLVYDKYQAVSVPAKRAPSKPVMYQYPPDDCEVFVHYRRPEEQLLKWRQLTPEEEFTSQQLLFTKGGTVFLRYFLGLVSVVKQVPPHFIVRMALGVKTRINIEKSIASAAIKPPIVTVGGYFPLVNALYGPAAVSLSSFLGLGPLVSGHLQLIASQLGIPRCSLLSNQFRHLSPESINQVSMLIPAGLERLYAHKLLGALTLPFVENLNMALRLWSPALTTVFYVIDGTRKVTVLPVPCGVSVLPATPAIRHKQSALVALNGMRPSSVILPLLLWALRSNCPPLYVSLPNYSGIITIHTVTLIGTRSLLITASTSSHADHTDSDDYMLVYLGSCPSGIHGDRNEDESIVLTQCDPNKTKIMHADGVLLVGVDDTEEVHRRKPRRRGGKKVTARRNRERAARAAAGSDTAYEGAPNGDHSEDLYEIVYDVSNTPAPETESEPESESGSDSDSEPEPGVQTESVHRKRPPRAGRKRTRQLRRQMEAARSAANGG